jgi:aspartate racemase
MRRPWIPRLLPSPSMKAIGLLGTGPQATIDLEERIHRVARRLIPQRENTGYPPLTVYHHRRPPVVLGADGSPILPLEPDPAFLEAARWLGQKSDILIISANAPHLFGREIEAFSGKSLLSMIDVTIGELGARGHRRVGVLGFHDASVPVYTEPLVVQGIACETIDPSVQPAINDAVMRFVEGCSTDAHRDVVRSAVTTLRARGVDAIILGCTELPLLLGAEGDASDLVNPAAILAEAVVNAAM